jgi:phosphoribosylformimino-5-aminoimidazole carboxamide ribotide isomerase
MRIIPVLDIKEGQVVRGIAGRRSEYRPIVSSLTPTSEPVAVTQAIMSTFGLQSFYLADLDALLGLPIQRNVYESLANAAGARLWIDAGLSSADSLRAIDLPEIDAWVIGLETLDSIDALSRMRDVVGAERLVFSLDLKEGKPLARSPFWQDWSAIDIAHAVWERGIERCILLDLARVGMGGGWGGRDILEQVLPRVPTARFFVAGGVRNASDLREAQQRGAAGSLVASALHDGSLSRADIDTFRAG